MVINTNLGALVSQRNLAESTNSLQRSLSRLSTGSKIVQPQDDAAGLAMAARLDARLKRIDSSKTAIANAISFVQTKDGYIGKIQTALERMSELATLAMDGTKSATDVDLYVKEFDNLRDFIQGANGISTKKFNGVNLFSASTTTVYGDEDGAEPITLSATDITGSSVKAADVTAAKGAWTAANAVDRTKVKASLDAVNTALNNVTSQRADLGSDLSRLNIATDTLAILKENVSAATSRIRDVDVADESASYARYSILVQAGTAMLAQANVIPQTALRLLS